MTASEPIAADGFHELMMQNEAVLILYHRHPLAKLDRRAGFALADPLGVGLKNGKDFFAMRNGFTFIYGFFE